MPPINNGSDTGEFLKLMCDIELDDPDRAPTCRLPVLCPVAFAAVDMSDADARKALAEEFGEESSR